MKKIAILGAGLAGSVLARRLHQAGAEVLLLEKGTGAPRPLRPDPLEFTQKGSGMRYTRAAGLGGTTSAWHAGLIRLQPSDIDQWFSHRTGEDRARLRAEVESACDTAERMLVGHRRLLLRELEPQGSLLLEGIGAKSHAARPRPIRLSHPAPNLYEHFGLGDRDRYPHIRTVAGVKRAGIVSANRTTAAAVEYTTEDGVHRREDVDGLVVAAGGLESPDVVRELSGRMETVPSAAIGKFYVDHPMGFLFRLKFRRRVAFGEFFGRLIDGEIVRYGLAADKPIDGLNHICYLRPANSATEKEDVEEIKRKLAEYRGGKYSPLYLLQVFRHIELLLEAFSFRFGSNIKTSYATAMMICEQEPLAERGVAATGGKAGRRGMRWFVSDRERRSINRFVEFIGDELSPIVDRVVFDPAWSDSRLHSAAHHSGMCRIGPVMQGVVDDNLRIHGLTNVFVCDGSVLPTIGHANTGLTIAALAVRLAAHLMQPRN